MFPDQSLSFLFTNPADLQLLYDALGGEQVLPQQQHGAPAATTEAMWGSSSILAQDWASAPQPFSNTASKMASPGLDAGFQQLSLMTNIPPAPISAEKSPQSPSFDDKTGQHRKDRRRAQNRIAQRTFRARKEENIKENLTRLEAIKERLVHEQAMNDSLSHTVRQLQAHIWHLRKEADALRSESIGDLMGGSQVQSGFRSAQ